MQVSAIKLWKDGDETVVEIETAGVFIEVIREFSDAPFSHIIEESGLSKEWYKFKKSVADGKVVASKKNS